MREREGGEGYRGRREGAETWGAEGGGCRGLWKHAGKCGSVRDVEAYLGMQEGLKGRGDERAHGGRNVGDARRCRSMRGDARGF